MKQTSTKMRGYDKEEVDELLDDVIADYETYQTENLRLQEENEFLKKKIAELEMQVSKPNQANLDDTQRFDLTKFFKHVQVNQKWKCVIQVILIYSNELIV